MGELSAAESAFLLVGICFLLAFLLFFALSASAQTDVSGVVKDSTGGVVSGAAVIARSSSGSAPAARNVATSTMSRPNRTCASRKRRPMSRQFRNTS